jgi:uncharacterized DUF497 family protein
MRYEWDPVKAEANHRKHDVRFSDAVAVFSDEQALTIDDPHPAEERYITLGLDAFARLLVVVYTWRDDVIRLISARKATRVELAQYAEGEP